MKRKKKMRVITRVLEETHIGVQLTDKEYYYIANKIIDGLKEAKKRG